MQRVLAPLIPHSVLVWVDDVILRQPEAEHEQMLAFFWKCSGVDVSLVVQAFGMTQTACKRYSLPDYTRMIAPLQEKLVAEKKRVGGRSRNALNVATRWSASEQAVYQSMLALVRDSVLMAIPDPDAELLVFTDASHTGNSIIVTQVANWESNVAEPRIIPRPYGPTLTVSKRNKALHYDCLYLKSAAEALTFWCARYGVPDILVSDQGSHFRNEKVKHLCARMKIQQEFSPVYSPWLNGTVERLNKDVLQVVRALLLEYKLDLHELPYLLPLRHHWMRSSVDDVDQFMVVNLDNVSELLELLRHSLHEMHKEVVEFNERRRLQDMAAHKGTPAKFDVIEAKKHSFLFKHLITGREYDVHASRLRFCCDEDLNQSAELLELVSSQDIMLGFEAIRDHRNNRV
ncbi:hypothetical protein PHMEG_00014894 [Phytophthora megakarya]|uniref:Integrase catalytic domain-containing protein n=1 Tax=Phytophthora megakarya TaxID=4795 RepID=A0A225W4Q1_9STRA|nr:hypothetical protein PHMEG_00014894 [Phytophthora megakarya]